MTGRSHFRDWRFALHGFSRMLKMVKPVAKAVLDLTPGSGGGSFALRYAALKALAAQCGDNVYVDSHVRFKNIQGLSVGENVSIHSFCYIDAQGGVEIGRDVSIAHCCSILSAEHRWDDPFVPIKYNPSLMRRTVIEDDVWIGCGVRILAGARIGRRCIVAAGAVVKGDLIAGGLYAGVPARRVRETLPADWIDS